MDDTNQTAQDYTRTGLMLSLLKCLGGQSFIDALFLGAGKVGVDAPTFNRRLFRALISIGIKRMLDAGVAPKDIAGQALEAIGNELAERAALAKENGSTQPGASA
jgi:hypothetical protein